MTTTGVLLLALLDSINPSAIVVTLYLLSTAPSPAFVRVGVYVAAIFVTYLSLGVMMLLGIDAFLPSLGGLLSSRAGLIAQSLAGLALLIYSLKAPKNRPSPKPVARPSWNNYAALAVLGVSVTAMELPTAIPYFAAVALMTEAALPIQEWAPLLGIYNLIFVLPPMLLLFGHLVLRQRLAKPYAALGRRLETGAREAVLWIAGLVGGWLFVMGVIELAVRWR